jgi:hypothetical protein
MYTVFFDPPLSSVSLFIAVTIVGVSPTKR